MATDSDGLLYYFISQTIFDAWLITLWPGNFAMQISYYPLAVPENGFIPTLMFLAQMPGVQKICKIGGDANPALNLAFIQEHNLDYTILDICQYELDKAPDGYHKVCCDITDEKLVFPGALDVFSHHLAEHIQCASKFHSNVFHLLSPRGIAFHVFPTLYTFPFVVNWLTPDGLAEAALYIVAPCDK
jgi:hypothetical protein